MHNYFCWVDFKVFEQIIHDEASTKKLILGVNINTPNVADTGFLNNTTLPLLRHLDVQLFLSSWIQSWRNRLFMTQWIYRISVVSCCKTQKVYSNKPDGGASDIYGNTILPLLGHLKCTFCKKRSKIV